MDNDYIINLITIYHVVFILIFFATAVFALGGMAKLWIFENMEKSHVNLLGGVLFAELIAAVATTYTALPKLEIAHAERYHMAIIYENYIPSWIKAQPENIQDSCFINNQVIPDISEEDGQELCSNIHETFYRYKGTEGQVGNGDVYLSVEKKRLNGLASYTFPDAEIPTVMDISGHRLTSNKMNLEFVQHKSSTTERDRPRRRFEVLFVKEGEVYRGNLTDRDYNIDLATIELTKL